VLPHWVNGREYEGTSDRYAEVTNPATAASSCRLALASAADVDAAV
jgi:malonate-semialdehyde dehydrogenase (acetylating)/methylmalonate-semialdehyde dehydrogenase